MRHKIIDRTPKIVLTMKEAHAIRDILNDYSFFMGEIEGRFEEASEADKLYDELDETILKAEAVQTVK